MGFPTFVASSYIIFEVWLSDRCYTNDIRILIRYSVLFQTLPEGTKQGTQSNKRSTCPVVCTPIRKHSSHTIRHSLHICIPPETSRYPKTRQGMLGCGPFPLHKIIDRHLAVSLTCGWMNDHTILLTQSILTANPHNIWRGTVKCGQCFIGKKGCFFITKDHITTVEGWNSLYFPLNWGRTPWAGELYWVMTHWIGHLYPHSGSLLVFSFRLKEKRWTVVQSRKVQHSLGSPSFPIPRS